MASSGMWRRVPIVSTEVSEKSIAPIILVKTANLEKH
jgi:hypothetical protein